MKSPTSKAPYSRRLLLRATTALFALCLVATTAALPTVGTSGGPIPPAHVGNDPYSISVYVQASPGATVTNCWAESNVGTYSGPNLANGWSATPTFWFTGQGTSGIHTFSVVNQIDSGYVWWRGAGTDTTGTARDPNPIGWFATP